MKADTRRKLLGRIETLLLSAEMKTKVAAVRALYPSESLPDIGAVYTNEEDYNKFLTTPCVLLFSHGPSVLSAMDGAYLYEFPVDICPFDVPGSAGLPALYNRLYAYQGCLTDLLLSSHEYEAGYWNEVLPAEPVDPDALVERLAGSLGRAEGYRFAFQVVCSYP